MLLTFLVTSVLSLPSMVLAQGNGGQDENVKNTNEYGAFKNYEGGFGGVFRDNMGYGGNLIGSLFEMLLLDGVDFKKAEMLESVYVLSASKEETYDGSYNFVEQGDTSEIHYLPYYDNGSGKANVYDESSLISSNGPGVSYCIVNKTGGFDYNLTIGAALTLIVWDHDKSFINAAQKVLDWAVRFREAQKKDKVDQKIVAEGVQILTWLLVHINEIFTGDELFVFNPIVWQTLDITPWKEADHPGKAFNITRTWMYTGDDYQIGGDVPDVKIPESVLSQWNIAAGWTKDSYMEWLLNYYNNTDIVETLWTQFSFDLAQLWVKKFYVQIDLEEVSKGENANMKKAFEGCDVEFYLFTHHLGGAFLYNDNDTNGKVTVTYDYLRNYSAPVSEWVDGKPPIIEINGTKAMIPTSNEITHRLILGSVGNYDFKKPEIDEKDQKVKWGLQLNNVNMSAVPVGVDLNSYMRTKEEILDYIYFGLDFKLNIEEPNDKGEIAADGQVKLQTNWAPWNNGSGPNNPGVKNQDLDLCIVYASSILHFHLKMKRDDKPEKPETDLLKKNDYNNETQTLKIGNYLDADAKDLEFVDMAGKNYLIGNDTNNDGSPDPGYYQKSASTSIIPVALWTGSSEMHETDPGNKDDTTDDFSSNVNVEAKWNLMLYAVCYPDFNSTGMGIWHDPTFSVYMVFTPESAGFWALILLISGVALAGVAAIIIKKKKEGFF
jgi:hypothetical protein